MQKYNLQKNPLKETKILQDIQNSITKSHVSTQAKMSSFKNPHIKIDILPGAKIHQAAILYNESKTQYPLPWQVRSKTIMCPLTTYKPY